MVGGLRSNPASGYDRTRIYPYGGFCMVKLRPMTDVEFEAFERISMEDYAKERARNLDTSVEEQRAEAARQYAELLKDGLNTTGHHLWKITQEAGEAVGDLWVHVAPGGKRAFIFAISIDENQRGKGYGKQALDALEAELKPLGVTRIGLNVFADNAVAQHLYEKQGYRVTNYNMVKQI
jgi:ribosomal protein S18 acetylase RimI-like enzyme